VLAGIALLAALLQPSPLSLRFEASYLQPTNDAVARGLGAGFGAGFRLTDQVSLVASAAQNVVWTQNGQPAGAPRSSRALSMFSLGGQAVLDATPIAPFLEATLVDFAPKTVAGYSLAARVGLGADWAFLPAWALGLAVRSFSPLDSPGGATALGGAEIAARLVWTPAF